MQQVVIKGRTYLNAYYVAKEYGYAPAYLRELYDTHHLVGVFWHGSLYLDSVSWQSYLDTHSNDAVATGSAPKVAPATAETPQPPVKEPVLGEHHYLHHARARRSRYERDEHTLLPQPARAPQSDAPPLTSVPAPASSMKIPVLLADAEPVQVQTVGPTSTVYAPAPRATHHYQGAITVEEMYDDETDDADLAAADTDSTAPEPNQLAVEGDSDEEDVVVVVQKKAAASAPATGQAAAVALDPQPETATPNDSAQPTGAVREESESEEAVPVRSPFARALKPALMAAMLLLTIGLISVLVVEQAVVAGENGLETTWRLSWQAATALRSW